MRFKKLDYAYALQRPADAVPLLESGMKLDPGGPYLRTALAGLYLDLGEDAKLARLSTLIEKRWPDDQGVQFALASAALHRADAAGAMRHAQRALDGYPHFPGPSAILRNADLQSGRYDAARARYEKAFPELFIKDAPGVDGGNCGAAIDLALGEQKRGDTERAGGLLDGAERACVADPLPRLGSALGYGIMDVQIHVLRGEKNEALRGLRVAERAGWRGPDWRYFRDFDPALAPIRNEPEFKAVFADIERDMARQRAALAARPRDAPLDLAASSK